MVQCAVPAVCTVRACQSTTQHAVNMQSLLQHVMCVCNTVAAVAVRVVAGEPELPEPDQLRMFTEHMAKLSKMMAEKVIQPSLFTVLLLLQVAIAATEYYYLQFLNRQSVAITPYL